MRPATDLLPRRTVLALAAAVLSAPARATAPTFAEPRAVVDVATVDLGTVGLGTEPALAFAIRNDGSQPLTLAVGALAPGLKVMRVDSPIAAGATGAIRLVVETFRAGTVAHWTVPVTTNDRARETMILQVRADIRAFILVDPPTSRITYVQHEREGGTTHLIAAAGDPDFRVTGVTSPYSFVDVTVSEAPSGVRPAGTEGRMWQVGLIIRRAAAVGPLHANVTVETNHPQQPRTWISLSGFVRPLLGVTPPSVVVPASGGMAATTAPPQTLLVTNFGEAPVEITAVRSSLPGIEAIATAIEPGRRWHLVVRPVPGAAAGDAARGELAVQTSRADVPATIVPLTRY